VAKEGQRGVVFGTAFDEGTCTSNASVHCDSNNVALVVNVDGLPIHNSSSKEFWPILCSFSLCNPFTVALYFGRGKPHSVEEFLGDFFVDFHSDIC